MALLPGKINKPGRELVKTQKELLKVNKRLATIKVRRKFKRQQQVRGRLGVAIENSIRNAVKEVTGEEL